MKIEGKNKSNNEDTKKEELVPNKKVRLIITAQ